MLKIGQKNRLKNRPKPRRIFKEFATYQFAPRNTGRIDSASGENFLTALPGSGVAAGGKCPHPSIHPTAINMKNRRAEGAPFH